MTVATNSPKGSQWRIWDMHVHTPASYGGSYDDFVNKAALSKAAVIGINDYCSIAGYEEISTRGGISDKIIFPVVEFRMHTLLQTKKNPNGVKINFHIIFDNNPAVFPKIKNWIASLECFDYKGHAVQLGVVQDLSKATFDFEKTIESLKKFGLHETHALIWLPYDEYGGIDEIDPNSDGYFKLSLISKAHIMGSSSKKQIDFFKWEDPKFTKEQFEALFNKPKPCIKGSDAHSNDYPFGSLRNQHSQPIDKFCWINADLTFQGLKQIVNEPDRVFIGEEPNLLKRVRTNKTKFVRSVEICKVPGAVLDDVWFDNFKVDINSGLVAIIGNKGGGKSAIIDIVSLCANTHQEPGNFSFLTNTKFRRPKPINLSEKFEATLTWEDDVISTQKLSQNPDKKLPERVKYIPQNFLEKLCSNIESDDFERELKQIIYSHTPSEKRLGKASLDELINYKSDLVHQEISQIQVDLNKLNIKIVELENKTTAEYRSVVENNMRLKQAELFAHDASKPIRPEAAAESEESKKIVTELNSIREKIKALEDDLAKHQMEKAELVLRKEELSRANKYYKNIEEQLAKYKEPQNEYVAILTKNNLNVNEVFKYEINTSSITALTDKITAGISEIEMELDATKEGTKAHQLNILVQKLKTDQEELDRPAKAQQKYLDDFKAWENRKNEIEGNKDTEGTLQFLQDQLTYLKEKLQPELGAKYKERENLAITLYERKLSLVEIRKELFLPITKYIEEFKELKQRYDVKIDVTLELKGFSDSFFNYVAQNKIGSYQGKEDGYRKLQELIDKSQFNTSKDFVDFITALITSLKNDTRTAENAPVNINSQLKKGIELNHLYDFIFDAAYLQPTYSLKLGTKTLQELSPGERGALLLIFYLILDNDDIPLIIDQPEENLDNESVYYILVHFIKKVKESRQIIIVTHNPNLAVVCDADQIIHMHIEKENKNTIRYLSGAIENEQINNSILNILEGTLPAFNNRDSKYLKRPGQRTPLPVEENAAVTNQTAEPAGETLN